MNHGMQDCPKDGGYMKPTGPKQYSCRTCGHTSVNLTEPDVKFGSGPKIATTPSQRILRQVDDLNAQGDSMKTKRAAKKRYAASNDAAGRAQSAAGWEPFRFERTR